MRSKDAHKQLARTSLSKLLFDLFYPILQNSIHMYENLLNFITLGLGPEYEETLSL